MLEYSQTNNSKLPQQTNILITEKALPFTRVDLASITSPPETHKEILPHGLKDVATNSSSK